MEKKKIIRRLDRRSWCYENAYTFTNYPDVKNAGTIKKEDVFIDLEIEMDYWRVILWKGQLLLMSKWCKTVGM